MPVRHLFRLPNLYLLAFLNNHLACPLQMHVSAVAAFGPECGFPSFTVVSKPGRLVTRQHRPAKRSPLLVRAVQFKGQLIFLVQAKELYPEGEVLGIGGDDPGVIAPGLSNIALG